MVPKAKPAIKVNHQMAIDFATFRSTAPYVLAAKFPTLIRGRHGIGKSEVVYQIARDLGYPVVERRASQMTEGDLLGMPSAIGVEIGGKRATTWDAPDWLLTACAEPVVLRFRHRLLRWAAMAGCSLWPVHARSRNGLRREGLPLERLFPIPRLHCAPLL